MHALTIFVYMTPHSGIVTIRICPAEFRQYPAALGGRQECQRKPASELPAEVCSMNMSGALDGAGKVILLAISAYGPLSPDVLELQRVKGIDFLFYCHSFGIVLT